MSYFLLAQRHPLEGLAKGFQRTQTRPVHLGEIVLLLAIFAGFIVALWVASRYLERRGGQPRPGYSRLGLFLALAKAHKLGWSDHWLLWRVARDRRFRDPARVFLEPQALDPAKVSPKLRSRAAQLDALAKRLFAGLPEEAEAPIPRG